jgi:hypothetical protein
VEGRRSLGIVKRGSAFAQARKDVSMPSRWKTISVNDGRILDEVENARPWISWLERMVIYELWMDQ